METFTVEDLFKAYKEQAIPGITPASTQKEDRFILLRSQEAYNVDPVKYSFKTASVGNGVVVQFNYAAPRNMLKAIKRKLPTLDKFLAQFPNATIVAEAVETDVALADGGVDIEIKEPHSIIHFAPHSA